MARVAIPGSFDTTLKVVTFTPTSPLPNHEEIFVTLTTDIRGTANQRLGTDYEFSFTVIDAVLTVASSLPADEAVEVAIATTIAITFSHNVDVATVNSTNIPVLDGVTPVAGSWGVLNKVATFTPTNPLAYNASITATVGTDVKGTASEDLAAPVEIAFLTIGDTMASPSTVPADEDVDVAAAATIAATFPVNIDGATVDATSFVVEYDNA